MNLNLTGKTALVTAASGGIGSGVAEALAEAGVRVAISGRTRPSLEMVAETLASRAGGRPAIVVGDVGAKGGPAQIESRLSSTTLVRRDRSPTRWMMPIGRSRARSTSWRRGG
jgi:3-oxoacyl-[acyl-carrier protein] reductase